MKLDNSLAREQKEAIGLLQIGTILEYFDLMLYVHMAVLLNQVFFPVTSHHSSALLSAFAFCSTFIFRPFGALIFGYIGDHIGRKNTVVITSIMMAICCLTMANLPTYAEIGIAASVIVTICRMLQGISSMGEIVGAEIYLTETIKPPLRYPVVAMVSVSSAFGSMLALGIATLVTAYHVNWRSAFLIGTIIAIVGSVARTRLRETPEFSDLKLKMKRAISEASDDGLEKVAAILHKRSVIWKEKVNWKTGLSFFLISCAWPVFFYFSFIYCGNILQHNFSYTNVQVIRHNLIVSVSLLIATFLFGLLSYKIHPLKIIKAKILIFAPFVVFAPYLLIHINTPQQLMLFQIFCVCFATSNDPGSPIFFVHFPVFKRFTYISMTHALSRVLIYITTSFGLVYLTKSYGYLGLWFIMLPVLAGFTLGIKHFEGLEQQLAALHVKKKLSQHLKEQGLR